MGEDMAVSSGSPSTVPLDFCPVQERSGPQVPGPRRAGTPRALSGAPTRGGEPPSNEGASVGSQASCSREL